MPITDPLYSTVGLNAMEQLLERARMAEGDDKNQGGEEHERQVAAF
jgi:hypothetical protein